MTAGIALGCLVLVAAAVFLLRGWWWSLLALKFRLWGALLLVVGLGGLAAIAAFQPWWVQGLAIIAAVGLAGWWFTRRARSSAVVTRWGSAARRAHGVASSGKILRVASGWAVRRKTAAVRPSLAGQRAVRTREVGVELARVGGQRMWSSIEDVVLIFGGPRTGKSGWLAARIVDAPGAAVVTSTRRDLYDLTRALRARRGPVFVFNAVGLGGMTSTVSFDPLTGCTSPVTAAERATDMLAAGSVAKGGDREFWEAQARRVLGALMHAAALGRLSMSDVLAWVSNPEAAQREVTSLLRKSPATDYVQDATQFMTTNPNTRSSITSTIMPALGWLTSPAAAAASSGATPLDVAALIETRGTVYLLGAEETQAAPLVCALTGHIAREARRIAATKPSGRLDPPLTLDLDEAALISPVPLQSWTADMGGRGVSIIAAFQSFRQLVSRWGDADADVILNNAGGVLLFGGTKSESDLRMWCNLAGDREEPVTNTDRHGRVTGRSTRKVPVFTPAQLSNLPAGHAVVIRKGLPPAVGKVRMAWKRRDVRAVQRWERRVAQAAQLVEQAEQAAREQLAQRPPTYAPNSPVGPGERVAAGDHA